MRKLDQYFEQWKKDGAQLEFSRKSLNKLWPSVLHQPIERIARLADPVTKMAVADPECTADLAAQLQHPARNWNASALGNVTLIAIACPDQKVRKAATMVLARVMKQHGVKKVA